MQARQEALLREGRVCIDRGLKIEETANSKGLRGDHSTLSEARKLYHYFAGKKGKYETKEEKEKGRA